MNNTPFFTIIIPTLNEEDYLPLLLSDLTEQTYQNFEVIVVDSQSEDATIAESKKFNSELNLNTISVTKRNVAHQRNEGARSAKGKWIIFMDADNRLPNYFLRGIRYQLDRNPDTKIFTCLLDASHYPYKHKPTAHALNLGVRIASQFSGSGFGALIGIKTKLTENLKFNEDILLSEDGEFIRQAVDQGLNFQYWTHPKFFSSFRRYDKDGLINISSVWLSNHINKLVTGKRLDTTESYPMGGGSYYQNCPQTTTKSLPKILETKTKKIDLIFKKIYQKLIN
jgi:hypothetical protein